MGNGFNCIKSNDEQTTKADSATYSNTISTRHAPIKSLKNN